MLHLQLDAVYQHHLKPCAFLISGNSDALPWFRVMHFFTMKPSTHYISSEHTHLLEYDNYQILLCECDITWARRTPPVTTLLLYSFQLHTFQSYHFSAGKYVRSYTSSTNHFWPLVHVTSNEHDFLAILSSILLTGSEFPPSFLGRFDFRVSSSPPAPLHNCVTPSAACLLPCLDLDACRITKQVIRQLLLVPQTSFTFPFCNRKHYILNFNVLYNQVTILGQVTVHHARCTNAEGLNINTLRTGDADLRF